MLALTSLSGSGAGFDASTALSRPMQGVQRLPDRVEQPIADRRLRGLAANSDGLAVMPRTITPHSKPDVMLYGAD